MVRCTSGPGSQVWLKVQCEAHITKNGPLLTQPPGLTLDWFTASATHVTSQWQAPGTRALYQGGAWADKDGESLCGSTPAMEAQVTADCLAAVRGWCWYQRFALGMHGAAIHAPPRLALCWLSCVHACLNGTGLVLGDVHMDAHVGAHSLHSPAL